VSDTPVPYSITVPLMVLMRRCAYRLLSNLARVPGEVLKTAACLVGPVAIDQLETAHTWLDKGARIVLFDRLGDVSVEVSALPPTSHSG
jgi:hypothetical protein